jgi:tRNA nucleotidyltransferase (CCA-adding enzyme)
VSGDDLIAAGMKPGKEIGLVLQEMLRDVVDVPAHNDRDYLLQRYLPS